MSEDALQGDCPDETWAALKRMAKAENDALLECDRLRQRLALATRLLRCAVTELNHHVLYDDAETMEFLQEKEDSNG